MLPSREDVLEFLQTAPATAGKREIARAFNIKGGARIALKRLLKDMADEGLISGARKRIARSGTLPDVGVIDVTSRTGDGELVAGPSVWDREQHGPPPRILVLAASKRAGPVAGIGDRLLASLTPLSKPDADGCSYEARPIRKLERRTVHQLGIFRSLPRGGVIDPIDRKQLKEWPVDDGAESDARNGELVRFEIEGTGRYRVPRARVVERLGDPEGSGAISLIAIQVHGLPDTFPAAALAEAESANAPGLKGREDLRQIPLVTIDPVDARDHDDAVFAMPDEDPRNTGGWVVIVAIADVCHFVRPGSALDREAIKRGNSVYFPDRVVPMLPEALSAGLCSLREKEDRACMAVRMVFDANGNKKSHKFLRGLMRSAARLTYQQAQAAIDGRPDDQTGPLMEPVLKPLWSAYAALKKARDKREPLDLDLPERKVLLDDRGQIADIVVPQRLEAHRLIEEFMIQANVAAAEVLEARRSPLLYRVHDAPSKEKLDGLRDFLATLNMSLPKAGRLMPAQFNRLLALARDGDNSELASEVVLRSQAQAEYAAGNYGHFGLNLRRYAHFTSPIRRYADLVVHRALVRALDLGPGGLTDGEIENLDETAKSISEAERRAMAAERETIDRLIARFLADRIGASFSARVSGVTRSGLFVRLTQTGADGFVPASSIGADYYRHDERSQALIGDATGLGYRLGDSVEVRLVEAIPTAGALRFELLSEGRPMGGKRPRMGKRGHRGTAKTRRRRG
ncbi:MAG: ribonuclease R [Pseudomonadota bacterium]|nr:ribonuclease R [Pseudomonadota bacterium]